MGGLPYFKRCKKVFFGQFGKNMNKNKTLPKKALIFE